MPAKSETAIAQKRVRRRQRRAERVHVKPGTRSVALSAVSLKIADPAIAAMTKRELRDMLAEAVRNTAAL